jgi:predicted AlkP superfamily pyrophosphatase or phosphodiesterase
MTIMLPTGKDYAGSLTDVVPSLLASIGVESFSNVLELGGATSAVLVLVDGLGDENLTVARGHARFVLGTQNARRVLRTVFPSTTACALVSLMTGESPGLHGVVGYRVLNPESGVLINQLTELDLAPPGWMRTPTLAEQATCAAEVFVVGRAKFADSALTRTAYRGAEYIPAESLAERFEQAATLARNPGRLVVVYASELDSAAHKFGVSSSKWIEQLELLDAELRDLRASLPSDVSVIVTADHGVIDVHSAEQIVFGSGALTQGVAHVGGEPRCLQLYLEPGADIEAVVSAWQEAYSQVAQVLTRGQVMEQSLLGKVSGINSERMGDLFVIARENVVFYDGRETNTAPQRMIGQHGSLSDIEMNIPLIELAAGS